MKKLSRPSIDLMGLCTSFICMLHCLSIPLLMILGVDSILWLIDHEWIELAIILTSLVIGSIAFYNGYLRHRQHFIPILFASGFLLIVNGESVVQEWLGVSLSVFGAAVIGYAHLQNLRWKQSQA